MTDETAKVARLMRVIEDMTKELDRQGRSDGQPWFRSRGPGPGGHQGCGRRRDPIPGAVPEAIEIQRASLAGYKRN
jgi:hypothetical protein